MVSYVINKRFINLIKIFEYCLFFFFNKNYKIIFSLSQQVQRQWEAVAVPQVKWLCQDQVLVEVH